ncbi:hypothetical protein [Sphingobacterium sp. UBA6645]|uniref:hypothetical protein n=1 Tax=Sphingobacterium sp. UBA6645 TaxID=1947511 RepID=UPI0025EDC7DF|nr:hypothetical protein [Sphingobacterium sp. UBA6645]
MAANIGRLFFVQNQGESFIFCRKRRMIFSLKKRFIVNQERKDEKDNHDPANPFILPFLVF